LVDINHNIDLYKTKIEAQSKYIKDLESLNEEQVDIKRDAINVYKEEIAEVFEESKNLGKNLQTMIQGEEKNYKYFGDKMSDMKAYNKDFNNKIKNLVEEARFFEDNDICPTCEQDIDATIKVKKLDVLKEKAKDVQEHKNSLEKEVNTLEKEGQEIMNNLNQLRQKQSRINSNNDKVALLQKEIGKTQKEIDTLLKTSGDSKTAKKDLSTLRKSKESTTEKKLEYVEERTYNEAIGEMLKDTGIKTKVIKQYLPVMNRLINQYLQVLDFFVAFHLDENFDETIRSRHRDTFNYASFSEGEKQRIDLALLFTWRQIAKMKNSASTNLLVLDETFDSSLDMDGIDNLTKILDTLEDGSNVFIISHKGDVLENKFRSKIEFFKDRNFSKIR